MDKTDFIKWVKKLQSDYIASDATKQQLAELDFIAIVGPTGVGKTTIINKLNVPYVLSDVSREKRPDEESGKNYYFRPDYLEIVREIKQGDYVQFLVSKYDEFYGTRIASYPSEGFCTMAVIAQVMPEFKQLGFRSMKQIYVMPPSYIEWMRRIGSSRQGELLGRIDEARQSMLMALEDDDYNFVLNDTLELAMRDVDAIINNKPRDEHRAQLARDTVDVLLERIGDGV